MERTLETLLLFYIYCLVGWIWESAYVSIVHKKVINRGFLNGPYIPIYGFGGLAIYLCLQRFSSEFLYPNTILIYICGVLLATVLEYITSFLLEKLFHAKWWDYSGKFMNLNGRICLGASLFWGVLAVLFVQIVNPFLLNHIVQIHHDLKLILVTSFTTTMAIDTGVTVNSIINLHQKITTILNFENKKIYDLKSKFNERSEAPEGYRQFISECKNKLYHINNPFTNRLISAFPKLKFDSLEKQDVFDKMKELRRKIKGKR